MKKAPQQNIQTKTYNDEGWFYMTYKRLVHATHWVDPLSGEEVKLSHNFKAYYHHRLDQYRAFTKQGNTYLESNRTVSDYLGIDYDMIRRDYNALLKRMGLLVIDSTIPRKPVYTLFELKYIKGWLINKKLEKHNKKDKKTTKKGTTWEDIKQLEKNKRSIDKIKSDITADFVVMTREELEQLIKVNDAHNGNT